MNEELNKEEDKDLTQNFFLKKGAVTTIIQRYYPSWQRTSFFWDKTLKATGNLLVAIQNTKDVHELTKLLENYQESTFFNVSLGKSKEMIGLCLHFVKNGTGAAAPIPLTVYGTFDLSLPASELSLSHSSPPYFR